MPAFDDDLFEFLADLADNNERAWFKAHQDRYEGSVREPSLAFIRDFEARLHAISPHFVAEAKKVGGSMFRIFRDVRFSRDKSPYKTHTGIQFRHERGRDVHAPGFYLHLSPGEVFVGLGMWHPDRDSLKAIRDGIVSDPEGWTAAKGAVEAAGHHLAGDSLSRAPRGYDKEHPQIDDLKRKDFITVRNLEESEVLSEDFAERLEAHFRAGAPMVEWLCSVVNLPY